MTTKEKKCICHESSLRLNEENHVPSCPCHYTQEKEWEREFDKIVAPPEGYYIDPKLGALLEEIRSFIRTTRQQAVEEERERLRKAVEGMKHEIPEEHDHQSEIEGNSVPCNACRVNTHNHTLDDVLVLLTSNDKSV